MFRKVSIIVVGFVLGLGVGYFATRVFSEAVEHKTNNIILKKGSSQSQVIGFLPYWLLDKAKKDYSSSITTLTYFGLQVDTDGTILRMNNPQELESGWNALQSGKVDPFLEQANKDGVKLSLLIFSGDPATIEELVSDPIPHAQALVQDVQPLMSKYGFTDLNLDIEDINDASPASRLRFTQFVQEVRRNLNRDHTLTVEISSIDAIAPQLIDPEAVGKVSDYMMIMTYDYHSPGSSVTGPVAPLSGGGTASEFDVTAAITMAKKIISSKKILLGIPLYGYEWETLNDFPRAAVIPGSGVLASSERAEALLQTCESCSLHEDTVAKEAYITYLDEETKAFHQLFYPTIASTEVKLSLANSQDLGGVALWALGYEGKDILTPLAVYKK